MVMTMSDSEPLYGTVRCFRCDDKIEAGPGGAHALTWGQETGCVYVCDDCYEVALDRNVWE